MGVTLAATLVAAFAPTESAEMDYVPPSLAATFAPSTKQDVSADVPSILISRPSTVEPASDPFSTSSWLPPPPLPSPEPPARPEPPALPYAYLGRIDDAGKTSVLLGQADTNHTVRVGDILSSVWRVERITDQAVEFIYLPLDARKSLSTGKNL